MFSQIFLTRRDVLSQLHFVAKLVSLMTNNGDCLTDFERFIPSLKNSISNLKLGYIFSLTFVFRLYGFDYSISDSYLSKCCPGQGDVVVILLLTCRSNKRYFLELVE